MTKNFKVLLIIFLLLPALVSAFSVQADQNTVKKGETIVFSGSCDPAKPIFVKGWLQRFLLFERRFDCSPTGTWRVPHEIGFLDPSGIWAFSFLQGEQDRNIFLAVEPVRESSLFVFDFLNSPPRHANRLDSIILDLKLLHGGIPVQQAQVFYWAISGGKKKLEEVGQGIYRGSIQLPPSAEIGDFNLVLVAQKTEGTERIGGEFTTMVSVQPAIVLLNIEKPSHFSFEVGKPVEWEVQASYVDNTPLQEGKVFMVLGENSIGLVKKSPLIYSGSLIPLEQHLQTKKIRLVAEDAFGNKTETEKNIVVSQGIFSALYNVFFWVFLMAVFGLGFAKIVYPKIQKTTVKIRQPGLEKEVREKIKKIQSQYYSEQSIGRDEYRKKMAELQKELDELKEI